MATIEIHVPDIGDFDEVTVIELMVKPGDTVRAEQSLITVESDKASMEIPSSAAGVVKEVKVALGDKVKQGSLVLLLEAAADTAAAPVAVAAAAPTAVAAPVAEPAKPATATPPQVAAPTATPAAVAHTALALPSHVPGAAPLGLPHASPSVRKFARELGVPLQEVKGSGNKGRITENDVQAFTRSVMSGAIQTLAAAQNKNDFRWRF